MNTLTVSSPSSAGGVSVPALWATIGVLGLAVAGLGATLYAQGQPAPVAALAPAPVSAPVHAAPAAKPPVPAAATATARDAGARAASAYAPDRSAPQPVVPSVAQPATQPATQSGPRPVLGSSQAATTEVAVRSGVVSDPDKLPAPAARVSCADCATVTAVTPIEREGEASGAGAVAGGVLGALVGQQFGGGQGKTLTTLLGAVGGGMAGHAVEKKMKKVTVYQVELRLDDASTRTVERATPIGVGARVRLNGNSIEPLAATAG